MEATTCPLFSSDALVVGSYTRSEGHVPHGQGRGVSVYSLHASSASTSSTSTSTSTLRIGQETCFENMGVNPSFLAVSLQNQALYFINEHMEFDAKHAEGSVGVVPVQVGSRLQPSQIVSSQGAVPCHVSLSPSEHSLVIVNYMQGNVVWFPIDASNGRLGAPVPSVSHGKGSDVVRHRQAMSHPHSSIWWTPSSFLSRRRRTRRTSTETLPDCYYVYVADLGQDAIWIYVVDETARTFHPHPQSFKVNRPPGSGPRHMALHPSKAILYVLDELSSTLGVYEINVQTGALQVVVSTLSTLPRRLLVNEAQHPVDNLCADLHVSSCARFLYCTNRGHDSITVFRIVAAPTCLEYIENVSTGGHTPRSFCIYKDYVLIANQDSHNLVVFHIDPLSGRLTPTGNVLACPSPACLQIVYAHSTEDEDAD